MDVSYLLMALESIRDETTDRHFGTQEALEWTIDYVKANWDDLDELLDGDKDKCVYCGGPSDHLGATRTRKETK